MPSPQRTPCFVSFASALSAVLLMAWSATHPLYAQDYRTGERLKPKTAEATSRYREIQWEELLPKDWNPMEAFKGIDLKQLDDKDPRAIAALEKLKVMWDEAPTTKALDGQRLRLAGFIIPLERKGDLVTELLLVPYFGACIHVPPPPANQIVHVVLARPIKDLRTMDAYWVDGKLSVQRGDSGMGTYGYRMHADRLEAYPLPKQTK